MAITGTPEEKRSAAIEALREVMDPELGFNIVELGLIRDVQVKEDSAHVIMILTTPYCPYAPMLLEGARSTTERVLGLPTTIEIGMEPWDASMAEEGIGADWGLY